MNYQVLGRSGLRVSDLCLGTMTFGYDWGWGAPKEEAKKIYDAFREADGNFIKSLEISFSPEQVRRLDDVSAVPRGFPNDLLAGVVRGSLFGGMRDRIKA
jgi:hypothetical protein